MTAARGGRWLVCGVWVLLGLALTGAQDLDEEARRIAQELQCPVCQGLSVADSPSDLARQMRGVIREKLQAGETREEILAYFVDRYGETIRMTPPRTGFTAVVWIAPYVGLLAGIGLLAWRLRSQPKPQVVGPAADPELDPYYDEADQTFDRVRDEALR